MVIMDDVYPGLLSTKLWHLKKACFVQQLGKFPIVVSKLLVETLTLGMPIFPVSIWFCDYGTSSGDIINTINNKYRKEPV